MQVKYAGIKVEQQCHHAKMTSVFELTSFTIKFYKGMTFSLFDALHFIDPAAIILLR